MYIFELTSPPPELDAIATEIIKDRNKRFFGISSVVPELQALMKRYGFSPIGTGFASAAFSHPSYPFVFKVTVLDDEAAVELTNIWMRFSNPHFPKIFGKPVQFRNAFMLTKMEKLAPCDTKTFEAVANSISYYLVKTSTADQVSYYKGFNWFWFNTSPDIGKAADFFARFPRWAEALSMVRQVADRNDGFDLHEGNIMMRGDIPVFLDPVNPQLDWPD